MDTKKIISIILIVVLLGGSLYLIYTNFIVTKTPVQTPVVTGIGPSADGSAAARVSVLPYGDKLDFSLLKKYNQDGRIFAYPQVDSSQIGIPVSTIIHFSSSK